MTVIGHDYNRNGKIYTVSHHGKVIKVQERTGYLFIVGAQLTAAEVRELKDQIYIYEYNLNYQALVKDKMENEITDEMINNIIDSSTYIFRKSK